MRISYIVPFALDGEGMARRSEQIPWDALSPDTQVECVAVRNHPEAGGTYYEQMIMDMYVVEAGLRAEEEGFDAVVMDTVSDSGLYPLRSRLSIPVIGPGSVSYAVATMLGKRFSIVAYLDEHKPIYEKTLDTYHLWQKCASIRVAGITPDFDGLFSPGEEGQEEIRRLTETARAAIEEDGADVILLGSTTMYEAVEYMQSELSGLVINPGPVAIKMAESMVQLGLTHPKRAFQPPVSNQDDRWHSLVSAAQPGLGNA